MLDQSVAGVDLSQAPIQTRIFISYSRKDGAFAEKLRIALIAAGFEALSRQGGHPARRVVADAA